MINGGGRALLLHAQCMKTVSYVQRVVRKLNDIWHRSVFDSWIHITSSPRATIARESISTVTGQSVFFFPYMGMTVILVKFQAYGCNGFHRIIGPVNAYP